MKKEKKNLVMEVVMRHSKSRSNHFFKLFYWQVNVAPSLIRFKASDFCCTIDAGPSLVLILETLLSCVVRILQF